MQPRIAQMLVQATMHPDIARMLDPAHPGELHRQAARQPLAGQVRHPGGGPRRGQWQPFARAARRLHTRIMPQQDAACCQG